MRTRLSVGVSSLGGDGAGAEQLPARALQDLRARHQSAAESVAAES